jgi:hypothetical protein
MSAPVPLIVCYRKPMRELMRTNEPVLLSFVEALLRDADIASAIMDAHISIMEGSIGILPRRVLVDSDDWERAARLLADADLGQWVVRDGR